MSDFKKYYDTTQKRNYWVLGYFGGNIMRAHAKALEYKMAYPEIDIKTIEIDEVLKSSRYKGFRFIYSLQQNQDPDKDAIRLNNVYEHLTA